MNTRRYLYSTVAVNLIVLAVLLEVAGIVLYAVSDRELFYMRTSRGKGDDAGNNPFAAGDYRPIVHPYFGFVHVGRPGVAERQGFYVNNHHFLQERDYVRRRPACCDFPVKERDADELIIGIFGGSVALATAMAAQSEDRLEKLLRQDSRYVGKRVRVLNFAAGAYKQPQQLQVLSYYLSLGQKFDAVVNIDGFNEVVLGASNLKQNLAASFPTHAIWTKLAGFLSRHAAKPDPALFLSAFHEIEAGNWAQSAESCRLASCLLLYRTMSAWHGFRAAAALLDVKPDESKESYFASYSAASGDPFEQIADQWSESVKIMHQLLAARSVPLLHVLQPNQWFRATSPYKARAPDEHTPVIAGYVPPGYRALLSRVPALRQAGVVVRDATGLFDASGSEIYSDDCCHFVPEGNQMLVGVIAQWLVKQ